jgi:hypothetical protein
VAVDGAGASLRNDVRKCDVNSGHYSKKILPDNEIGLLLL